MPLTPRQTAALARLARSLDGTVALAPDLARQLVRRGLVRHIAIWQSREWNRVVATLHVVELTAAGRATAGSGE